MKLYPEDPRLSAYVLGELSPEDTAAVESAAVADSSLQRVIDESSAMQSLLTKRLTIPTLHLLPEQRESVLRAATGAASPAEIMTFGAVCNTLKPWLIPAAAAAVLAVSTLILLQMPEDEIPTSAVKEPAVALPAAVATAEPTSVVPAWSPHRASVKAADFPSLQLPILAGKGNLELIRKSILSDETLPATKEVKLEQILNDFPLRLSGVTAIARRAASTWHPDSRDGGIPAHVATLSTEMIACPWKPSSTLLLVSLRGNALGDCEVKLEFRPNPATVLRYRLLGSTSEAASPPAAISSRLPAKTATTMMIEIEPFNADRDFGSLEWTTDAAKAPSVSLVRNDEAEPSDDARFAVLVCTYAQWLAGEQVGMIDADIVSALAREVASGKLDKERVDFLALIDKSLHL